MLKPLLTQNAERQVYETILPTNTQAVLLNGGWETIPK